jgi:hypothetical protein
MIAPATDPTDKIGELLEMKQPVLGICATLLTIAIALAFISRLDFATFAGWVSYYLLCIIPMQIVVGVTWGTNHPSVAAKQKQPGKGALLALTTLIAGAVIAPAYYVIAGGSIAPPSPMLMHVTIVSVVVTFWASIMFGGWPFKSLIKSPVASGLTMLVACYALNYVLFEIFYDYGFMQGAPVYVASLDPHGMFNALSALVYYVTALAVMFFMLSFDLWPLTKMPKIMQQPMLGIVWTIIALALGGFALWVGVGLLHMDVMAFLVTVPVPFIFGTIVVLNMLQNSLFRDLTQPAKGVANVIAVVVIGGILAQAYRALAPIATGALHAGPPTYDLEIWLASALLSVTFPFLIFFAEFFKFWPLAKPE